MSLSQQTARACEAESHRCAQLVPVLLLGPEHF
jgi:hypothetical protein